jgi:catechol 2,3-dioxygenase-like lactoylglutathione lyase family enzyme
MSTGSLGGPAEMAEGWQVPWTFMEPLAIHHVSINVSDVDEAMMFYTDVLGGTVRRDRPDLSVGGAWIDLGTQQVHLLEAEVPPGLGQHFAILVADLDDAVSELRAKGIAVREPTGVGSNRQTFVRDPSGNLVELHEVGSG